jgi:hypothetical protein
VMRDEPTWEPDSAWSRSSPKNGKDR